MTEAGARDSGCANPSHFDTCPNGQSLESLGLGRLFSVDFTLDEANPDQYDALMLPGGVMNPDKLRRNQKALDFVRAFFDAGKPIAAICHAPWTLVDADVVQGRTLTSYPSLQTDLKNAGAKWVDEEFVVDNGLVTSRNPDDIPLSTKRL